MTSKRIWATRTEDYRERQGFRRAQNDDNFEKANKVPGDVENNIPILDDEGDLKDSGYSFDDVKLKKSQTRTVTSDYQVVISDEIIWVDASSGAITITMISATDITGQTFIIEKIDSSNNAVTIAGNGSETINGDPSFDLLLQYESVEPTSTGTGFLI